MTDEPAADQAPETGTVEAEAAQAPDLGAPSLRAALEALLIVAVEPVEVVTLAQVTGHPIPEVTATLAELASEYVDAGRGFALREVAGGWRFYTAPDCSPIIERWVLDGQQARLSQAALETLAIVAYRQPVSRARVGAIRGVNVEGVMRTLVSRGLIAETGTDPETGAILYRTTSTFLERIGVATLEDLPDLAEYLPALAELDDVVADVLGSGSA